MLLTNDVTLTRSWCSCCCWCCRMTVNMWLRNLHCRSHWVAVACSAATKGQLFTDHVNAEGNEIGPVRLFSQLNLWLWSLFFCVRTGRDHSSQGIETQGQGSRSLRSSNAVRVLHHYILQDNRTPIPDRLTTSLLKKDTYGHVTKNK